MNRKFVVVGLATVATLAVAAPVLGGPSLKELVSDEVAKQLEASTAAKKKRAKRGPPGPQGPVGPQGPTGAAANLNVEPFHIVGDPGEPAFENSWVNFGAGTPPASFYKDPLGRVHLRGTVQNGTTGTVIFTLPVGYRPANGENLPAVGAALVTVASTGTVTPFMASSTVSINGISFRAGG
jgi:hypothetical protein